jgi:dynamin GTPase/dynamin 1-like protein
VPFEILVRKQIGRLLDPSLQCAQFIYDELIKVCVITLLYVNFL